MLPSLAASEDFVIPAVGWAVRAFFTPVFDGLWALALPYCAAKFLVRRAHADMGCQLQRKHGVGTAHDRLLA